MKSEAVRPELRRGRLATFSCVRFVMAVCLPLWIFPIFSGCDSGQTVAQGPAASWTTQLSVAQQAAEGLDKDAQLYLILAFPAEHKSNGWSDTDTLELVFHFAGTKNDDIMIEFNDAAPTSTLKISQEPGAAATIVQANAQKYQSSLESVKLSPREAVMRTWQDAAKEADLRGIKVLPLVGLKIHSVPTEWHVSYVDASKSIELKNAGHEFDFLVDAQTGKILEQDLQPWYPDVFGP